MVARDAAPSSATIHPVGMTADRVQTTPRGRTVCIVDDDPWVLDSLTALLEAHGFEVLTFGSGAELLADHRLQGAGYLIVDHHMPGMSGLDTVQALRREGIHVPAILVTGRLDTGTSKRAARLAVAAVLEKPFSGSRLVELIRAGQDGL
jgi:putative two-component system response regulator